jgi:hypothetical protein
VKISIKFDPHDLWIGAYWKVERPRLKVYICLIPMLPICIEVRRALPYRPEDVITYGGMIEPEQTVMDYLVAAWRAFTSLNGEADDDDVHVFRRAIHQAQSILARRALHRIFPEYWR